MRTADRPRPLAVITGASSGFRYHLGEELARRGCDLVVCADDGAIHDAARTVRGL